MNALSTDELRCFLVGLGVLLGSAWGLGGLARRFRQPAILGEIVAGIVLGPTLLGSVFPQVSSFLFPKSGGVAVAMDALTTLAIVMFLLVTGMRVELSTLWRQGRSSATTSILGMVVPFAIAFALAWFAPSLLGADRGPQSLVLPLFFGTALSISALPVVAKILLDLRLSRSKIGAIILTSAVCDDVVGWLVFGVILGMVDGARGSQRGVGQTIGCVLGFTLFVLTVGKGLIDWLLARTRTPAKECGGALALAVTLGLFSAACTEWMGLHAILGAFLFGVALGGSSHLCEKARGTMEEFISNVFAPLFFASIGLKVDFVKNFDGVVVGVVLLVAVLGKVLGCRMAARWASLTAREAWAIGFGLNARGAMGIILSMLALRAGIIQENLFVAIALMSLVTSLISGPMIQRILRAEKGVGPTDLPCPATDGKPTGIDHMLDPILEPPRKVRESPGLPQQDVHHGFEMSVPQ